MFAEQEARRCCHFLESQPREVRRLLCKEDVKYEVPANFGQVHKITEVSDSPGISEISGMLVFDTATGTLLWIQTYRI